MCVIALVQTEEQRLTPEQIGKMWSGNSFGAGAAWFSSAKVKGADVTTLHWKKGLEEDEIQALLPTLPLPYAVHFRNPSPNTSTNKMACHPFIVNEKASCALGGSIPGGALIMHNGFWSQWRDKTFDIGMLTRTRIPGGPWTDSRAIAFAAHVLGAGVLEFINEKVLYFSTEVVQTYGLGWTALPNGLLVSNTTWQNTTVGHHNRGHHSTVGDTVLGHHNRGFLSELDRKAALKAADDERAGGAAQPGTFRPVVEGQVGQEGQQAGTATLPRVTPDAGRADAALSDGSHQQEGLQQEGETVSNRPMRSVREQLRPEGPATWARRVANGTDCQDCGERPGTIHERGVRRCWPCYDAFERKSKDPAHGAGTCETCRKLQTTHIRTDDGAWICDPCWRLHGKPEIVRNQDLTGVQRKKIEQARQAGGSL